MGKGRWDGPFIISVSWGLFRFGPGAADMKRMLVGVASPGDEVVRTAMYWRPICPVRAVPRPKPFRTPRGSFQTGACSCLGSSGPSAASVLGDLAEIHGLAFEVSDPSPLEALARVRAWSRALNEAKQLADLAGTRLGLPVEVRETPLAGAGTHVRSGPGDPRRGSRRNGRGRVKGSSEGPFYPVAKGQTDEAEERAFS